MNMYPNTRWARRVDLYMPKEQIIAIYRDAERRGKLDQRKPEKENGYRQLDLFTDFGLS